jgi:ubiquinone/menaquinone biosynthesis C-methylase UbiE
MGAWLVRLNRRLMDRADAHQRPSYVQAVYQPEQMAFYRERLAQLDMSLENKMVLDVGCGAGQWLMLCAEARPARLIGGDYSRGMLRAAMEAGVRDRGIRLFCGDAMTIPLRTGRFDLVICALVLPYVPSDQRLVRELARVCKPGGRLLLSFHGFGFYLHHVFAEGKLRYLAVPPVSWISFMTGKKLLWNTYQSLPRVRRLLEAHGFEVERVAQDWSYMRFPYIVYVTARKRAA